MLSSRLALLFVLIEWVAIIVGYSLQPAHALYNAFIYGSPIYMAINLFTHGSALLEHNPMFLGLFIFHILKYITIFKAQIGDDGNGLRLIAIILEVAYVLVSGYIMY